MPTELPETPQPKSGGSPLITDYFKPAHHVQSEPTRRAKREVDGEEGSRSANKLRSDRAIGVTTFRFKVYADTPKPQNKTATSTRLSLGSEAVLRDSPKSRWNAEADTAEVKSVEVWSTPVVAVVDDDETVNDENHEEAVSDDDDETVNDERYEMIKADMKNRERRSLAPSPRVAVPKTVIDLDSEHEPIHVSDAAGDGQNSEEESSDKKHDHENKENIPPKLDCSTPSTLRLPLRLKPHHDQNDLSTPSGLPEATPLSSLLPSPVNVSTLQSSPSPAPLGHSSSSPAPSPSK
ncbi:hypothetical protein B0T20DRAFT_390716 [Sordaria brevicollis]|uniref:Uncharacterized protein n=1 Tax=Sordaria brevicollis TaxID=83679 RepID=A0AAE0PJ98_SORBR|nr:hypothetical protein B0T20DRAFT_390716 [Sordaria brevicollis]